MDKLDLILDKIESMEKALRSENKELCVKIDKLTEKTERTWQAVQEIRDELTENSVKIKIIDNKVKAL